MEEEIGSTQVVHTEDGVDLLDELAVGVLVFAEFASCKRVIDPGLLAFLEREEEFLCNWALQEEHFEGRRRTDNSEKLKVVFV